MVLRRLTYVMDSIIVSVKHSGTRFLRERLGVDEYVHTDMEWNVLVNRVEGKNIIVPLRKPEDVWASWWSRGLHNLPIFLHSYYTLHALDQLFDVDYIAVDRQVDERITDWTPVGNKDKKKVTVEPFPTDLRVLRMLPIIRRYYE